MASDNIAAKKKRSFTKVLQSKVWPLEDLFWPSTTPIARVLKWLSGDNRGHVDLQKSKHRIVYVPALDLATILKHLVGHHFPAKAMGKEQVKGGCLEEVESPLNFRRSSHRCILPLRRIKFWWNLGCWVVVPCLMQWRLCKDVLYLMGRISLTVATWRLEASNMLT